MYDLRESDYSLLRARMDSDLDIEMLVEYVLKDPKTKQQLRNAFNVTLNDPRTYMERCHSILGADKRRFEITGIDAKYQNELEQWIELCLYVNDEQLSMRGNEPFEDCLNWFILRRGWAGSLWLLYKTADGKVVPSIIPCDPRWMTWEISARGLKQFSYRTRMGLLEAEDKFKKTIPNANGKKYVNLQCIWDDKNYVVYQAADTPQGTTGDPLEQVEHGFGVCPGVVTPVPTQPMIITGAEDYSTSLSRQGESIMAANRGVYPMLNKVASIMASIAEQSFKSSLVYMGDKEGGFTQDPTAAGGITQIGKDEHIELMPARDLSQALTYLFGMLGTDKQKGGLSDINYGQIQFQVASLVVAQLKDDRDGIFVPRRKAKKTHYRQGFNIFRQMIKNGKFYKADPNVVNVEDAIEFDPALFEKKFIVAVNYTSISPEENISNYTIAAQAKALGIPKKKILRDILHDEDPDETMRQWDLEQAYDVAPMLRPYDMAIATDPGQLTQKQINEDRGRILFDAIRRQLESPEPLNAMPGVASLPKIDLNKASPEKISQKRLQQTGQMAAINGQRAGGLR